jgi:nucleoporin p58/p45
MGPGQQPQRSIFSASIGQYTQAAQTVPGVRISLENLRPTTRFEDLHEDLQKTIEHFDTEILGHMRLADECSSVLPAVADVGMTIPPDVAFLESKLDATRTALVTDATAIDAAKRQVRSDASDAQRSFHTIAALRMPSHLLGRGTDIPGPGAGDPGATGAPGDPTAGGSDASKQGGLESYFSGQADAMSTRLSHVQRHFSEVEEYLSGLEAQTAAQVQNLRMGRRDGQAEGLRRSGPDERIRELAAVLSEFERGILTVAASVGQARELVQEAQLAEGSGPRWRR